MENCKCEGVVTKTPWYHRGGAVAALMFLFVGLALSVLAALGLVNFWGIIFAVVDLIAAVILAIIDAALAAPHRSFSKIERQTKTLPDTPSDWTIQ